MRRDKPERPLASVSDENPPSMPRRQLFSAAVNSRIKCITHPVRTPRKPIIFALTYQGATEKAHCVAADGQQGEETHGEKGRTTRFRSRIASLCEVHLKSVCPDGFIQLKARGKTNYVKLDTGECKTERREQVET